jgi:membrane-anchored protein YejM (alkaline phosphatase superfamily)
MEKKNVIIICVDGGRLDRALKSDTFAQLSSKCIFFPQTITYAPYTNSAIHALISGSYGNRNGCYSYWHSIKFKKNEFKTLTEYLHDVDYFTHADTPSDLVLPNSGFDKFEVYDESVVDLTERHKELLENMKQINDQGKNFFLYLHYESIHTGILNPVLKAYDNYSKEYFENRKINEERYDKLFRNAENYIENLLEKMRQLEFWKNSIILVTSDHGISVGEKFGERAYGAFCYDYTIKTFAYYSNCYKESKLVKQQIRHVDFMPTILDDLGIPLDKNFKEIDGVSLIPVINGEQTDEQIAYTETGNPLRSNAPPKEPNTKSVRTSKWKLIHNEYDNSKELYDLENDPNEDENLSGTGLEIEEFLWEELLKIQKRD